MESLKVIARFKLQSGKFDEFKILESECIKEVEDKDQGTLEYDWYYDEHQQECIILESYQDSESLLEHLGHVGEQLSKMMEIASFSAEIFGKPSEALLKATRGLDIKVYHFSDGI
ncbi:MAG: putative quinol monooxygenase [Candidatus Cyclobacteriaceae bacterium M3_2C_046]